MRETITLENDLSQLSLVNLWVAEAAAELSLPPGDVFHWEMCLEEIVTNVMKYAYGDGVKKTITLTGLKKGNEFEVRIEDTGQAFNPLKAESGPQGESLSDMHIGGLGIHLTLKMMDRVEYDRIDDRNILTLAKKIGTAGE